MVRTLVFSVFLFLSRSAFCAWSLNVGAYNPLGTDVGINLMYLWTNWAAEVGVGTTTGRATSTASADVNMKYLFMSGGFRPYVQLGTGLGASSSGVSVGGSVFGGVGFFAMGSAWYGYLSYNTSGTGGASSQAGIGRSF